MREFARRFAARSRTQDALRLLLAGFKQSVNRRRALRLVRKPGARPQPQRVLVVLNGGIGNAVEATPLVQAIRAHWPDASIDLCTPYEDLFRGWCLISRLTSRLDLLGKFAWDQTFIPWSSTLSPQESSSGRLGRVHVVPLIGAWFIKPEREYNLDMIRALGYRGPTPPLYVSVSDPGAWSPDPGIWVALVPGGQGGAKWKHKHWPHFDALLQSFLDYAEQVNVCILGGSGDPDIARRQGEGRVLDMRGRWSLGEVAWVLKQMDVAVGNDCGPMHIADAVRVPTVTLFGPTCELKNGPLHGGTVLTTSIECRPCQYARTVFTCSDPRCLSDLSPDAVLRAVAGFLPRGDTSRLHLAPASPAAK